MMPRIVISQTHGSIAIEVTRAKLEPKKDRTEINVQPTPPAKVDIKSELPQIKIDQTAAFASAGLKRQPQLAQDFYDRSFQKGMEQIGVIADEGMEFLRIENKSANPVADQADRIGADAPQLTVVSMPSQGPEISVAEGQVNINFQPKDVSIDWEQIEGTFEYVPYEVKITMAEYPSIEIRVEPGRELDLPGTRGVGVNVDEAI